MIDAYRPPRLASSWAVPKINLNGCVLYLPLWRPDMVGSSFISRDVYGHLCTVTGATWRPYGRYFDGTDDKITIGTAASLAITGSLTIITWFNLSSLATVGPLVNKCQSTSRRAFLSYFNSSPNAIEFYISSDGTSSNRAFRISSSTGLNDDTWHMFAGVYVPSTTQDIYLDGALNNGALTGTIQAGIYNNVTDAPTIGQMHTNDDYFFKGTIGETLVYNRALSQSEISRLYLATKWRYQ